MIHYTFIFDEENIIDFEIDEEAISSFLPEDEPVPEWIALETSRCDCCTIDPGQGGKPCPAAVAMRPVVDAFSGRTSYETVRMIVVRDEIKIEAEVPTQRAVRSLLGLLLPFSACPVMKKLRPMARLHLPLGDQMNTCFRFLGMHLIVQYIKKQEGQRPDWDLQDLFDLFADIHTVNRGLASRIRAATELDAAINALILLDAFADAAEYSIERSVKKLKPLFSTHFQDESAE